MAVTDTNYNSTLALTDVVNVDGETSTQVNDTGMSVGALYTLLGNVVTNFNAMNAKLDNDAGVTDVNYASSHNLTALASRGDGLEARGMGQDDLYNALSEIETNFNAVLTKLDSDAGVADEDYNDTYAVSLDATASGTGLSQDIIVSFLDDVLSNFNDTLTKLDADAI